jgi:hypothetical protein
MKSTLSAFAAGVVFGVGLGLSGMTQTAKVLAFLDFFGAWDPSLMFVMGGSSCTLIEPLDPPEAPLLDTRPTCRPRPA